MKAHHLLGPSLVIFIGVILRLIPHPPNFAPIAAMALFGGVYLDKKYALIIPLLALFLSDVFLGFYAGMFAVYGSFFLTGCIGLWLKKHKRVFYIVGGSLVSSLLFFVVTNFNFWYIDAYYPKTIAGLVESYVSAIPFFRNTLMGDLFYTALFFGGYEVVSRMAKVFITKKEEKSAKNSA